jgi:hypothetical protein
VAHTCNPSYSGGRDQEVLCSKPARANSSGDPISKKTLPQQRTGRVARGVGPKPQYCKTKQNKKPHSFHHTGLFLIYPLKWKLLNQTWWHTPTIPALQRQRQEDYKFEDSCGCVMRPCLKWFRGPAGHQWLTPVILATWETEMLRIAVRRQPEEIV